MFPSTRTRLFGILTAFPLGCGGAINFTDISDSAGVSSDLYTGTTNHALGINWIDFNNDGWDDLFLVNGFDQSPHLFQNDGNGFTFTKVDELLPGLPNYELMGSVFGDYDNDGDSDIYIFTDHEDGPQGPDAGPPNLLLKNLWMENGQTTLPGDPLFEEVAAAAGVDDLLASPVNDGPAYRSSTGGWVDYDRDGNIDLYICHWNRGDPGSVFNKDRLYRNKGDGTFEDVTASSGVNDGSDPENNRPCLAFIGAHLDGNMWPDLYVANVAEPLPYQRDMIFQNQRTGSTGAFIDRTLDSAGVGDDSGAAMGVTVADIDHDGDWDIYLSDLFNGPDGGTTPLGNPLYLHTGIDILYNDNSAAAAMVEGAGSWGVNFFDADQDGYEDLYVGTMSGKDILYHNNQTGSFTDISATTSTGPGGTRGTAISDFDQDGDMDIAVVGLNGELTLLRNDSTETGHWLQIKLNGVLSNRDAINALVKVSAGGKTVMRQVVGGASAHSQDSLVLHFGLGPATTADMITIYWPSGIIQELTAQAADQLITVTEPPVPVMTSPVNGALLDGQDIDFNWTANGAEVRKWTLKLGTTPGGGDIFRSKGLSTETRSVTATGLPIDGSTVYARLRYRIDGVVYHTDHEYTAATLSAILPSMTAPANGSTLPGDTVTFEWDPGTEIISKWGLRIGTSLGTGDIYRSGKLASHVLSTTVSGLPTDGSQIHVRLRYIIDNVVTNIDYQYTAAASP